MVKTRRKVELYMFIRVTLACHVFYAGMEGRERSGLSRITELLSNVWVPGYQFWDGS